jgi:hypothetical protein
MTEGDLALHALLDPLVPQQEETVEWDDVLRRAQTGSRSSAGRRRLSLAAVAVAVILGVGLSPVGAAIADRIGDFSAWVRGEPGSPATPAEEKAFQRENERTWASFAPDAKLRRLLKTTSSGTSFVLYGFRSGDDLCLRLVASGAASGKATHCAPLHALQTAKTPVLVVATDEPIGTTDVPPSAGGFVPEAYSTTFGIASDGVKSVTLHADDGTHEAIVAGNAFLYVGDHPRLGTRVRSAEAVAADGSRVALELQSAPFGFFDLPAPPKGEPQGPSRVERRVSGGSIGWIERLEPRGEPFPKDRLPRWMDIAKRSLGNAHLLMARVIQPDPGDFFRIGIAAASTGDTMSDPGSRVCTFIIDRDVFGGGCGPMADLFRNGPFSVGQTNSGSDQYSQLSGLASDDVATLKIFPASGSAFDVALRDNAYVARVARSDFPIRLVAYDSQGRVIGIQTFASDGMTSPAPREAQTSVHEIARVTADGGATAVLEAGTPVGGYRCWTIIVSDGGEGGGCTPWPSTERPLLFANAHSSGGDVFLTGELPPQVASLTLTYAGGETAKVEPIEGFLLYAVPSSFVQGGQFFVAVRAFDAGGKQIDERGIAVTSAFVPRR